VHWRENWVPLAAALSRQCVCKSIGNPANFVPGGTVPSAVDDEMSNRHRKKVRHYHEPGDLHELTFSCYQRKPLLTEDDWRQLLCRAIDKANSKLRFRLVAFVLMPEHVHLLVDPLLASPEIDRYLSAIKRPHSGRIKRILDDRESSLVTELTVQERPGKIAFRYWQEGPGYDRNLTTESAVMAAIEYIHNNPVRRGLVSDALAWRWSSARWYASDGQFVDPHLPTIHGLRPGFWC
jgi:putative transposase